MLSSPRIGQEVEIRYGKHLRPFLKHLHERRGTVVIRSNRRPRNHLVQVDGKSYVVPCGNLFSVKASTTESGEQRRRTSPTSAVPPATSPRTAVVDR